jgi:hypothetical protein
MVRLSADVIPLRESRRVTELGELCCVVISSKSPRRHHGSSGEALDERERVVGDVTPTAVDRKRMAADRDPGDLGHAGFRSCLLYEALTIAQGTV